MALIVAAGGGGYYYAHKYLVAQSQDYSTKLAEQEAADERIASLNKLKNQYNRDVVPILPLIDETLPHNKQQSEVLAQIQRMAGSTGLQITSVSIPSPAGLPSELSQTTKAGAVLALPILFKVDGTYPQLQAFTAKLENLNRFTNITTLSITRGTGGVASYSFSLSAYIKP